MNLKDMINENNIPTNMEAVIAPQGTIAVAVNPFMPPKPHAITYLATTAYDRFQDKYHVSANQTPTDLIEETECFFDDLVFLNTYAAMDLLFQFFDNINSLPSEEIANIKSVLAQLLEPTAEGHTKLVSEYELVDPDYSAFTDLNNLCKESSLVAVMLNAYVTEDAALLNHLHVFYDIFTHQTNELFERIYQIATTDEERTFVTDYIQSTIEDINEIIGSGDLFKTFMSPVFFPDYTTLGDSYEESFFEPIITKHFTTSTQLRVPK